jgi:dTDP-4-amino-4,6-dideoxygalactose transaminase
MDPILEIAQDHGLVVLEDVAQAFGGRFQGRPLGTLGHVGAFSFYPTKNLGAFGDAGLLTTNDDEIARTTRKLRTHGAEGRNINDMIGYNSRLDEIQAAVLRVKLPYVEMWNRERRRVAATYLRLLADVPGIVPPIVEEYALHAFNQYTIRVTACDRDALQRSLAEAGVGSMVYYSVPVHRLPIYASQHAELPVAEKAAREVLSLPIGPMLSNHAVGRVVDVLRQCLSATAGEVVAA